MAQRGHSNAHVDQATKHATIDAALIPIEGGARLESVKPLPPLALRKTEWRQLGDRMDWWKSTDKGGGTLWLEFHDRGGRVAVDELTSEGIHNAKFQCEQMLEELETAQEKLDAESEGDDA